MKKIISLVLMIIAAAVLVNSQQLEKKKETLSVTYYTLGDRSGDPEQLVFNFSDPMTGKEKKREVKDIISISPHAAGEYLWRSATKLIFTPSEPFPVGRSYSVRIKKGALSVSGSRLPENIDWSFFVGKLIPLSFRPSPTEEFEDVLNAVSEIRSDNTVYLDFNRPVPFDIAVKHMPVTKIPTDETVACNISLESPLEIKLVFPVPLEKNCVYRFGPRQEGLIREGGIRFQLLPWKFRIYGPFVCTGLVSWLNEEQQAVLSLRFSRSVEHIRQNDKERLIRLFRVNKEGKHEPLDFKVSTYSDHMTISPKRKVEKYERYIIVLGEEFKSSDDKRLTGKRRFEDTVLSNDMAPRATCYTRDHLLHIELQNIKKADVSVYRFKNMPVDAKIAALKNERMVVEPQYCKYFLDGIAAKKKKTFASGTYKRRTVVLDLEKAVGTGAGLYGVRVRGLEPAVTCDDPEFNYYLRNEILYLSILKVGRLEIVGKSDGGKSLVWVYAPDGEVGRLKHGKVLLYRNGKAPLEARRLANDLFRLPLQPKVGDIVMLSGIKGGAPWYEVNRSDIAEGFHINQKNEIFPLDGLEEAHDLRQTVIKGGVFTERGFYLPGDTVHIFGSLREYDIHTAQYVSAEIPAETVRDTEDGNNRIALEIRGPGAGRLLDTFVAVDRWGGFVYDFNTAENFTKGKYTVRASYKGKRLKNTFKVEFYRPNTFEINIKGPKAVIAEAPRWRIEGRYLSGLPMDSA
ncbi:MAG: hypothetical protein GY765_43250, partial [bacterium]|nr:hypothetical protein [bacterium]